MTKTDTRPEQTSTPDLVSRVERSMTAGREVNARLRARLRAAQQAGVQIEASPELLRVFE